MVFCTNCGADMDENVNFCSECGNKVELNEHSIATTKNIKEDDLDNVSKYSTTASFTATKKGVLDGLDIQKGDIDQVTKKAKKGLGRLGRFARIGLERGSELASQGIEVAKETLDERMEAHAKRENKICPHCSKTMESPGKFCNHCGEKLE
jgi:tRNA(Ile2) C34 agmatinyltransferase TiaS